MTRAKEKYNYDNNKPHEIFHKYFLTSYNNYVTIISAPDLATKHLHTFFLLWYNISTAERFGMIPRSLQKKKNRYTITYA